MENNSYNGNDLLKAAGFEMQFTSEQVKELMRCKEDPIYFIENYCYIVSLDRGLIVQSIRLPERKSRYHYE